MLILWLAEFYNTAANIRHELETRLLGPNHYRGPHGYISPGRNIPKSPRITNNTTATRTVSHHTATCWRTNPPPPCREVRDVLHAQTHYLTHRQSKTLAFLYKHYQATRTIARTGGTCQTWTKDVSVRRTGRFFSLYQDTRHKHAN